MNRTNEMVGNQRLDAANRIKLERYEEFERSLFADVYEKAAVLASLIIDSNLRDECEEVIDRKFCMEEQYSNIISFLGERGMGKSSAMLSFALFLKKYDDKNIVDRFKLSCKTSCEIKRPLKFYVLSRIDAAMMVKGENLIDIILAKMWSDFCEKINSNMGSQSEWKEVEECFEAVKKSYEVYQRAISGKDDRNMTSIRQMNELARCLNLRNDFRKLVSVYLDYMAGRCNSTFFVLTIDDLDIVSGRTDEILEQIRLFLMVPRVIVLATADYGRLYLECNKSLSSSLICPGNIEEREKRQIRGYTEKYLAKIFPGNMRIHMPRLNMVGGVPFILSEQELGIIGQDREAGTEAKWIDDKKALFLMIAYYSGIMMYPFDIHFHILQKQSLRTIVNDLFELRTINQMPEQSRFRAVCQWLQTALIDYGRTVTEEKTYEHIQMFLNREVESVFKVIGEVLLSCIAEFAPEKAVNYRRHTKWADYGSIMMYLHVLEKAGYHEFVHFVLVWYSVQLSEEMRRPDVEKQDRDDIFYPTLQEENKERAEGERELIPERINSAHLQIVLAVSPEEEVEQWMLDNMDMICDAFKVANLGEWNLWYEDRSNYLELYGEKAHDNNPMFEIDDANLRLQYREGLKEGKAIIKITAKRGMATSARTSFEIMLSNALEYRDMLEGFLRNVYRALSRAAQKMDSSKGTINPEGIKDAGIAADSNEMQDALNRIMQNERFEERMRIEKFNEWKNEELFSGDLNNWLPMESMEIMLHLAEEIYRIDSMSYRDNLLERIINFQKRQLDTIIAELEEIEKYYGSVMGEKGRYTARLKKLQEIVNPYDIGVEFARMTSRGRRRREIDENTEV